MSKMKKLEELGISPAPWGIENTPNILHPDIISSVKTDIVCIGCRNYANASLISAAPELYECLREEFEKVCTNDGKCTECQFVGQCRVKKLRTALAKASGEDNNAT